MKKKVLFAVLAAVALLAGCDKWHQRIERSREAQRQGLARRKSFLEAQLPEEARPSIPEDFYAYDGFRDWYRLPLVFPYQLMAIDSTLSFTLARNNGKGTIRNPNQSSDCVRCGTEPCVTLARLTLDSSMLLFKKDGVEEYGLFQFGTGEFSFFATEDELWEAARLRGFNGLERLVPAAAAYDNYWKFGESWLFASKQGKGKHQ